ncbi:hypothetical protein AVEN_237871-1, partial [Araneus ventricosus]
EESLDSDDEKVNMIIDQTLADVAKSPSLQKSPTNSRNNTAVPDQQTTQKTALPPRMHTPPNVIDNPLCASALMKTISQLCEKRIMGKILPGNQLSFPRDTRRSS